MIKRFVCAAAFLAPALFIGCAHDKPTANAGPTPQVSTYGKVPGAMPDNGFKAQLEISNPPTKLRAGEKSSVQIKLKNASDVIWYARGAAINTNPSNQFYIAAGNRWLAPDGKLVTNMDGRYGLDKDLKPGEETTLPLQITAPKDPGDYLLEVDMLQEQVSWFSDKGSPTARAKVTVVR